METGDTRKRNPYVVGFGEDLSQEIRKFLSLNITKGLAAFPETIKSTTNLFKWLRIIT